MGFLWRRRSSVLKIVCLLSAVWFTVAFLIYSDDRRGGAAGSSAGGSGSADVPSLLDSHNLALKQQDPAAFDFNNNNDIGEDDAVPAPMNGGGAAMPGPMVRDRLNAAAGGLPAGGGDGAEDAAVAAFGNVIAGKIRTDELKTERVAAAAAAAALDDGE